MPKITPFLWFDDNAQEAMEFYASVFKNSEILSSSKMGGSFMLEGQKFNVLNGGPKYKFNEAVSMFVDCEDQTEVDYYWEKLTADGGEEGNCGWLKDKYGLSWQIVPEVLGRLFSDPDREKADRAVQAMLKMNKIEIDKLQAAFDGK